MFYVQYVLLIIIFRFIVQFIIHINQIILHENCHIEHAPPDCNNLIETYFSIASKEHIIFLIS